MVNFEKKRVTLTISLSLLGDNASLRCDAAEVVSRLLAEEAQDYETVK